MAATLDFYDSYTRDQGNGSIALGTDTFYIMLLDSGHTPDLANHDKRNDVEGDEVSGTGYTAGGQELASDSWTLDGANDRSLFDAANAEWDPVTFTNGRYAVIYKRRGGASSADELVCIIDLDANYSPSAQTFRINFNATGIFALAKG
jgi:hypothetical protein